MRSSEQTGEALALKVSLTSALKPMPAKRLFKGLSLAMTLMLSACASQNALLKSQPSVSTIGVDQINEQLDQALLDNTEPPELSVADLQNGVLDALSPKLDATSVAPSEPRFDISVDGVPAAEFFAGLVFGTNRNIVVHPEVEGTISLNLKEVTIGEVLDVTEDIYGFEYVEKGRLIKVYPAGLRTKIFHIDYPDLVRTGGSETRVSSGQITQNSDSSSSDSSSSSSSSSSSNSSGSSALGTQINTVSEHSFWGNLAQTLRLIIGEKDGHSVVMTPSAGIVVVRADASGLQAVESYLEQTELTMQRQVTLEAKILEVTLSDGYEQGIDWSFSEAGRFGADGVPRRSIDLGLAGRTVNAPTAGGIFASTVTLGNFNTTIDLLGTQGNVQVLSSPRISTVNNQKAVIKVGTDEYFVTDIDFESDNDTDTASTDIELTPFFSGIALDVTPQISEEGKIILHVHPVISEVEDQVRTIQIDGQNTDLPLALSTIRESDSIITAENGQIVVIGGLIQTRVEDDNSAVPFFSDIPLVGEIFKQKSEIEVKTELVILLKPTITDSETFKQDISDSRARFQTLRDQLSSIRDGLGE